MEDASDNVASWFCDPMYGRYWQHYQQAMGWQQRHWQAYRKALIAAYGPAHHPTTHPAGYRAGSPRRYDDWEDRGRGAAKKKKQKRRRRRRGPGERDGEKEGRQEEEDDTDEEEEDEEEEEEIECDVSNMEITEELRQYFAQTEKHKEELKRQQQDEAEQEETHVPADRDMHRAWGRSGLPPSERPGERRGAEMKRLYGQDAAMIQGMETAMQLTFDRSCDKKQPRYWPVIPLKL